MTTLKVHHGAWVLVGDGKKALLLNNEGDAELLNLRRISVREQANPATHLQGTDAPGRGSAPSGIRHGSMGDTDWHQIEEDRFAAALAGEINTAAEENAFREIVIVAPPKCLAEIPPRSLGRGEAARGRRDPEGLHASPDPRDRETAALACPELRVRPRSDGCAARPLGSRTRGTDAGREEGGAPFGVERKSGVAIGRAEPSQCRPDRRASKTGRHDVATGEWHLGYGVLGGVILGLYPPGPDGCGRPRQAQRIDRSPAAVIEEKRKDRRPAGRPAVAFDFR